MIAAALRTGAMNCALSVMNVKFRDAQGIPEWTGSRGMGARRTIAAVAEKVTAGAGIEMPTLVIKAGTEFVTVRIWPERILLDNDLELAPGDQVSVVAAYSELLRRYVALRITNAAGATLVLRNEDGTAAW